MNLSPAQKLMIEYGFPAALFVDQATRAAAWKGRTFTVPGPIYKAPAKAEDATTKQLRAELEAAAAKKKAASLERLREWKIFNNRSLPKPELKPRAIMPITEQETTTMAKKAATTKKPAAKKAAVKPARKAAAAKSARTPVGERSRYDWKGAAEKAAAGSIPPKPDFSAPTHARFLPIMDQITAACSAKDLKALKAIEINAISSTPKAMARYRDLCAAALTAKAA
jgi:hypothetical protein